MGHLEATNRNKATCLQMNCNSYPVIFINRNRLWFVAYRRVSRPQTCIPYTLPYKLTVFQYNGPQGRDV